MHSFPSPPTPLMVHPPASMGPHPPTALGSRRTGPPTFHPHQAATHAPRVTPPTTNHPSPSKIHKRAAVQGAVGSSVQGSIRSGCCRDVCNSGPLRPRNADPGFGLKDDYSYICRFQLRRFHLGWPRRRSADTTAACGGGCGRERESTWPSSSRRIIGTQPCSCVGWPAD